MTTPSVLPQRRRLRAALTASAFSSILASAAGADAEVITFETLPPVTGTQYNGSDDALGRYYDRETPTEYTVVDKFGEDLNVRTFTEGGVTFLNKEKYDGGYWEGFAYSNVVDLATPGFTNQYAAYVPPNPGPDRNTYGVAFGYYDLTPTFFVPTPFDPTIAAHLQSLPTFVLPVGTAIVGMNVANTTYAALSMMMGDSFAKKFGGADGTDPDWFKLTAYGIDANGDPLTNFVDFYLADFRSDDPAEDYIVTDWTRWDLSSLADARSLHFNLSSSDVDPFFGLNTPGYFAMDDLEIQAVPEPTSLAFVSLAGVGIALRRYRRSRRQRQSAGIHTTEFL